MSKNSDNPAVAQGSQQEQVLDKRPGFVARTLFIVFLATMLLALDAWSRAYSFRHSIALARIIELMNRLDDPKQFSEDRILGVLREWLPSEHRKNYDTARDRLWRALEEGGIPHRDVLHIRSHPSLTDLIQLEHPIDRTSYPSTTSDPLNSVIDSIRALQKPNRVRVLSGVSPTDVKRVVDHYEEIDVPDKDREFFGWNLVRVQLKQNTVVGEFDVTLDSAQPDTQEQDLATGTVVELESGPSILSLAGMTLDVDESDLSRLASEYGTLPLADAKRLAEQSSAKSYETLPLLGFQVPLRVLPLFVCAVSAVLSALLYSVVRHTKRGAVLRDDSIDTFLIGTPVRRVVIWCILPVLSIWLCLAATLQIQRSPFEIVLILAGSAASFWFSVSAARRAGAWEPEFGDETVADSGHAGSLPPGQSP